MQFLAKWLQESNTWRKYRNCSIFSNLALNISLGKRIKELSGRFLCRHIYLLVYLYCLLTLIGVCLYINLMCLSRHHLLRWPVNSSQNSRTFNIGSLWICDISNGLYPCASSILKMVEHLQFECLKVNCVCVCLRACFNVYTLNFQKLFKKLLLEYFF